MIIHKHKCIFIHIPKCAGSSIEFVFDKHAYDNWEEYWDADNKIWTQHATAEQIKQLYCEKYDQYFSFSFVRNPWDRCVSDYFWAKEELEIEDTFNNYLQLTGKFSTSRLGYPHLDMSGRGEHVLPQTDFILNSNGEQIVDFVGRFETLQHDFNTICNKIEIPQTRLPFKNKIKRKHYTEYYDDETRQIVAEKYAEDIEYFGYEFGK